MKLFVSDNYYNLYDKMLFFSHQKVSEVKAACAYSKEGVHYFEEGSCKVIVVSGHCVQIVEIRPMNYIKNWVVFIKLLYFVFDAP